MKRSKQGMLTTRVATPWLSSSSAASMHSETSEPVPIRIASGPVSRPSLRST